MIVKSSTLRVGNPQRVGNDLVEAADKMAGPQSSIASDSGTSTSLASDKVLRSFLAPTFDPASYLNATLPSWTPSSNRSNTTNSSTTTNSLTELNNQTQQLVSQLSAQLTRLTTQLTKLTDDILRSGGRLAYEVEILRGETGSLSDVLVDGLADEIARFVPGGLKPQQIRRRSSTIKTGEDIVIEAEKTQAKQELEQNVDPQNAADAITRLRTLALVRDRLESVVKVFGAAADWTVPPSDVNMRSTFISVAGPEAEDTEIREKRGKAWQDMTREEVGDMVVRDGYEAAVARVDEFAELAGVWKGTSEEKARQKFVEGLRKLVDDRKAQAAEQPRRQAQIGNRSYGLR